MQLAVGTQRIELTMGDIAQQQVDAIVNAANSRLAGGGGVDGAMHRHGGPAIMAETDLRYPDGCPTGSAVISTAGDLSAQYVIHAVGPFWNGGNSQESELLAGAYRRTFELTVEHQCQSVAVPALSTGAYRYPMDLACRVALQTAFDFLQEQQAPEVIRFVLFSAEAYGTFAAALEELSCE